MSVFSKAVARIASLVLDLDDTQQPAEQIAALNDFLSRHKFEIKTSDIDEFLGMLKKKHFVDSITISKFGELVASSEGNGVSDSFTSTALLEFITKQIAKPETVLLKLPSGWFMLFPLNESIYIVKAGTNLSTIELRALSKEIEKFIVREKQFKNKKQAN